MTRVEEAILENSRLPEGKRKSNRALADELGVNESSVRKARKRLEGKGFMHDEFFGIPVEAITKRGKTVRLLDGSYEKISYDPGRIALEEAKQISLGDLEGIFSGPEAPWDTPERPTPGRTRVICLSDFQVGKTGSLGGSEDLIRRVVACIRGLARDIAAEGGAEEIIIADVGDSIEGFHNTMSQAQTNDLSLTEQLRLVTRLYLESIRLFAPLCRRCVFVSVPSNHCAVRGAIGSKAQVNAPDDDYGLLIADFLSEMFEGREGFEHLQFAKPQKWEESLTVETLDGTHIGFTHGHLAGRQTKMGDWFSHQAFGCRSGLDKASVLVHGHFHNFGVSTLGNNRHIISCPTLDNGSDWFANLSGNVTIPGLLTFLVGNGLSSKWEVRYE